MTLSNQSVAKLKDFRNTRGAPQRTNWVRDLPAANSIGQDGVHHINTWMGGTHLGKELAMSARHEFIHCVYGKFISVEAFYFWITSPNRPDRVRTMPHEALVRVRKKNGTKTVINLKALTMDAVWQMLHQTPDLLEYLKAKPKKMRFDHYRRQDNGLNVRASWSTWWVAGLEEIVRALHKKRHPDFSFLMDRGSEWIYEDAKDWYVPPAPTPEPSEEPATETTVRPGGALGALDLTPQQQADVAEVLATVPPVSAEEVEEMTSIHTELTEADYQEIKERAAASAIHNIQT